MGCPASFASGALEVDSSLLGAVGAKEPRGTIDRASSFAPRALEVDSSSLGAAESAQPFPPPLPVESSCDYVVAWYLL